MEGFKTLPKMKCGGKVYKKDGGEVESKAEDKKLIKKAFAMHDKQEHSGEKTDLSKLRKGGRC